MEEQFIDLCQSESLTQSALKRTDLDTKQQEELADLVKEIKDMKEQYEKTIAKIKVDNKDNRKKEIDSTLSAYQKYHGKSKYGKTFASKLEYILKPREVMIILFCIYN